MNLKQKYLLGVFSVSNVFKLIKKRRKTFQYFGAGTKSIGADRATLKDIENLSD